MRIPFMKRHDPEAPTTPTPMEAAQVAAESDVEVVNRLAGAHLPDGVRERWLQLLRPAVQLVKVGDGQLEVARLGGLPSLPADVPWPVWEGHGPLAYVGELQCEPLSHFPLDVPIPRTGRLLFFYFDGSYDDASAVVGTWDPSSLRGARAVHVADATVSSPRATPEGVAVYPERVMAGRPIVTAPDYEHPDLQAAFRDPGQERRSFMKHPVNADDLNNALLERHTGPAHQVGGYALPVQGPVEYEVAQAALDNAVPHGDPRLDAEARRWELLLQVDSDDDLDMMWGDVGTLYWMARPEDLARDDLTDISFTWQCG